jgi:hypothetical protein
MLRPKSMEIRNNVKTAKTWGEKNTTKNKKKKTKTQGHAQIC